jgi:hypothetical protein
MPYIKMEERKILYSALENLIETMNTTDLMDAGHLNYIISTLLNAKLQISGCNYKQLNELIGVLECAKLELYRRVAAPYEDTKKQQNGEVYE